MPLYKFWAENDKHFSQLLENHRTKLEGIRVLGQDPLETVFVFICSANNHVRRITSAFFLFILYEMIVVFFFKLGFASHQKTTCDTMKHNLTNFHTSLYFRRAEWFSV